jgi:hypothetical protein
LPIGVRAVETITASAIGALPFCLQAYNKYTNFARNPMAPHVRCRLGPRADAD